MFKDFLFLISTFLGLFALTLNSLIWGVCILFLIIILRLVVDVIVAVGYCVGESNYGDNHPN